MPGATSVGHTLNQPVVSKPGAQGTECACGHGAALITMVALLLLTLLILSGVVVAILFGGVTSPVVSAVGLGAFLLAGGILLLLVLVLGVAAILGYCILRHIAQVLAPLVPGLQQLASALRTTADFLGGAGTAIVDVGQDVGELGASLEAIQLPSPSIQTDTLWNYVPLGSEFADVTDAPDIQVITAISMGNAPLLAPLGGPVNHVGQKISEASGALENIVTKLRECAQIVERFASTLGSLTA